MVWLAACAWPAAAHAVVFGSAVDGAFNNYTRGKWTYNQMTDSLQKLRAAGASVAQTGSDWVDTEPKSPLHGHHRYDWTRADLIVRTLAESHLRWEPVLDYTPKWAQQHIKPAKDKYITSPLPPLRNSDYGAYSAAVASRYGPGGSFWRSNPQLPREPVLTFEIWNEPDCRWTWGPDVNLRDYAKLYMTAYHSIKRADRHATVVTGGLAFNRTSLPRLLKAFKGLPMDGLGVHPYGANAQQTIGAVDWTEQEMIDYGRGRTPLFVDEYGWNSVPKTWQAVSRRALGNDVQQSLIGLSQVRRVREVIPFEWTDSTWGLSNGGLAKGISRALRRG